jgi:hypothetical protein
METITKNFKNIFVALIVALMIKFFVAGNICVKDKNLLLTLISTWFTLGSIILTLKSILITSSFGEKLIKYSSDKKEASQILTEIYDRLTFSIRFSIAMSSFFLLIYFFISKLVPFKISIPGYAFELYLDSVVDFFILFSIIYSVIIFFGLINIFSAIVKEYFTS